MIARFIHRSFGDHIVSATIDMTSLHPSVLAFLKQREQEFDNIDAERKTLLDQLTDYVQERFANHQVTQLTFLCTHNSRRSHLSQIWAKVAADYYRIQPLQTYSGGTEATALNPRVVDSLKRTGFEIKVNGGSPDNPLYLVSYSKAARPLECFSKTFDASTNPADHYAAVMTCSSADRACPVVPGSDARLPIRYDDPKVSDGTSEEAATYDARSRQICREMLFAMSRVVS
ncbi:MAG: protein-tyrosine-phosphatase [Rubripirellula sp.]